MSFFSRLQSFYPVSTFTVRGDDVEWHTGPQPNPDEIETIRTLADVPQEVDATSALKAIDQANLSSAYTAWASAPDRSFSERAFIDKAAVWKRNDPVLLAGAAALGLTSEQVDQLFILAATL